MEKSKLNNLMNRIQKDRDEIAFSEIFDFFAPKINAYFIQNSIKIESSEELTQEVLSTVWVKSNLYDSTKSALSTWIFTIARNKKIDFFRKNSKINFQEEDIREFLYQDREVDPIEENEAKKQIERINNEFIKLYKFSIERYVVKKNTINPIKENTICLDKILVVSNSIDSIELNNVNHEMTLNNIN